ncbi:MAG TPA: hypothetical protein VF461_15430 [Gemmatimonadaceae bacterium]
MNASITKLPHIVVFGIFFLLTALLFDKFDRRAASWSLLATVALGVLVELEEGASRTGHCSLTDLLPDVEGAVIAGAAVLGVMTMRHWMSRTSMPGDARVGAGAALLVALVTLGVGVVGLVDPETLTELRRSYFATPARLYTAGTVRVAMGLVLILAAPSARWPRIVRVLGALMCFQGLAAILMGPEHARAVLEWETLHASLSRYGAVVALLSGGFLLYAVRGRPAGERM